MKTILNKLFKPVDNAPLILFRILFGLLFILELCFLFKSGWVKRTLIQQKHNFTFFGFDWLNSFMGLSPYVFMSAMFLLAFCVLIGFKYRINIILLSLGFSCMYLLQKTDYNNYHYLLWLVSIIMCFLPAHRYASIDVRLNPKIKTYAMPQWIIWLFIFQISCVYFYATIAKLYPGWLSGTVTRSIYYDRAPIAILDSLFKSDNFFMFIAYAGIIFDGLIIPALLWRKTRWLAITASLIFHLSNSYLHSLGTFPYFTLSLYIFFFNPETIRKVFIRKKPILTDKLAAINYQECKILFWSLVVPYTILQILLPLRHYAIKGEVLWTEEGHRLSWRLMLRYRSGYIEYKVIDKKTGQIIPFNNEELITKQQSVRLVYPDIALQMAHLIKKHFSEKGKDVAVYASKSNVSINDQFGQRLIDPNIDLASEKWNYFGHNRWMLERKNPKELLTPMFK